MLKVMIPSCDRAALAVASSPSGWAKHCMALGAIAIGETYCLPNRDAVGSMSVAFRKL